VLRLGVSIGECGSLSLSWPTGARKGTTLVVQSGSRAVTLLDVAARAGVSRAAVSIVLRGKPGVSDGTRERVLQAMADLGYVYHRGAASLRSARSKVVGVVVHDISNSFFSEMTHAIDEELAPDNYVILLGSTADDRTVQDRVLRTMQEHQVDGLILSPADGTVARDVKLVGVPLVLVTRQVRGLEADYVGAQNKRGGYLATTHLLGLGHRRVAFVGGSVNSSSRRERQAGYKQALNDHGVAYDPALDLPAPPTREGGREALGKALALEDPPSAIFCYSDYVAVGCMVAITSHGKRVGEDVSVVGFDGIAEVAYQQPALSTVVVSPWDIGRRAARLLLSRMSDPGQPVRRTVLAGSLVNRSSTGPAQLLTPS